MKKLNIVSKSSLLLGVIIFFNSLLFGGELSLVPNPKKADLGSGKFLINNSVRIIIEEESEKYYADEINEEIRLFDKDNLKISSLSEIKKLPKNIIFIGSLKSALAKEIPKGLDFQKNNEAYFLRVNENGITIIGQTPKSRFYGVMTLLQLFKKEKRNLILPFVEIYDYPSMRFRGISDDISRGQISTKENFKKIIKFLSRYKLNIYSPYIEDVFEFKNHPEIGKARGALSKKDWNEIDEYAQKYFVEIIPIFESLGHWENLLIKPAYQKYAEFPGAQSLNVSDEKIYLLLDELIKEVASTFKSQYFNMAADESWDVGLGASKHLVEKSDLATVHFNHYKKIFDILKKYKKRPLIYGDIILSQPAILSKLPKDIIVIDWQYHAATNYETAAVFDSLGIPFVVSPAISNYDFLFPNYLNAFVNIKNFTKVGFDKNAIGVLNSNWNDNGAEDLRELNYYGYGWSAECAWNPSTSSSENFNKSFFKTFFSSDDSLSELIYSVLSSSSNIYNIYELWRHPFHTAKTDLLKGQSIKNLMPSVLSLIEKEERVARKNKDHFEYLKYICRLNLLYAKKIQTQENIKMIFQNAKTLNDTNAIVRDVPKMCDELISGFQNRFDEYENLWLKTNHPEMINLLRKRMNRQKLYWEEIKQLVLKKDFTLSPFIESKWIAYKKESGKTDHAIFKKSFLMNEKPIKAEIQLIGDSFTKLYVNENYVGEVMARSSLSLQVEYERVKIFDVTKFLKDSLNEIIIDVKNYSDKTSASTNIYGEIKLEKSVIKILSDISWQTAQITTDKLNFTEIKNYDWQNAVSQNYSIPLIKPNFNQQRASWFDR